MVKVTLENNDGINKFEDEMVLGFIGRIEKDDTKIIGRTVMLTDNTTKLNVLTGLASLCVDLIKQMSEGNHNQEALQYEVFMDLIKDIAEAQGVNIKGADDNE